MVAGSLTKGFGLADSDVDGFVIVTDEAFDRRRASGELTFFSTEFCDYEGGYVDAKYVDRAFLEAVVERGSEAARSAFLGAIVAWSTDPSIDALVHAAATYPEAGVEQRMARFLAQAQAAQWYVGEAAKRDDPYLAGWAASRLALFACRLVLAHNRVLYPYHKWLLRTVAEVPDRPWRLRRPGARPRDGADPGRRRGGRDVAAPVSGVAAGPGRLVDAVHAGQRVELARR